MTMMKKKCSRCGKIINYTETCDCKINHKRKVRNKYQRDYYEKNKDQLKLIKNAKWYKLRKQIIKRDGAFCRRCFAKNNEFVTENLQVHHIKPRIDYPELIYDDKNLVTICKQCNLELGTSGELDFNYKIPNLDINM